MNTEEYIKKHYELILLISIMIIFIIISIGLLMLMGGVSAQDVWWDGEGGDNLASTAVNWNSTDGNDIAPTTGDDVTFNTTSVKVCTWDITEEITSFLMDTGYSGTVTQACEVTISGDCTISDGELIIDDVFTTLNYYFTGGTLAYGGSGYIALSGDATGKLAYYVPVEISSTDGSWQYVTYGHSYFYKPITLKAGASITITGGGGSTIGYIMCPLTVETGATLNFTSMKPRINQQGGADQNLFNYGIINSVGSFIWHIRVSITTIPGTIYSDDYVGLSREAYSPTLTFGGDALFNKFIVNGYPLDTAGYNLSCTDLTLGVSGILKGGEGNHTISGDFDGIETESDFQPETSTFIFPLNNSNIQINSDDSFYNLVLNNSYYYNFISQINVTNEFTFINLAVYPYDFENDTVYFDTYTANEDGIIYIDIRIYDIGNNYRLIINTTINITSTPEENAYYNTIYYYNVTFTPDGCELSISTNADWLDIDEEQIRGIPSMVDSGFYWVNITISSGELTNYQNYTLEVNEMSVSMIDDPAFILIIILIFLIIITVFNLYIYMKGIPIIQIIITIILLFATIPIIEAFENMVFIPLFFLIVNIILMVMGALTLRD